MGDKYIKAIPSFPDITGKEDKSNKVQNLNSPNSTTYPSTNAVKNALDSKVESVTGTGVDNTDPINPIINIDKHTVGLGNVDNTSDIDKPISTATQAALNNKQDTLVSGVNIKTVGGQSILGAGDIPGLTLGETSSTAYRGDRGKTAYDHSQLTSGNPHNVTKTDVGLSNVDNTSDANKPISTAAQTALNGKEDVSNKRNNLNSPNNTTYPTTLAVLNAINSIPDDGPMTIRPITYIDLMSLKTGKSLVPGTRYFIGDRDIWIDALDKDKLAMECKRHFRIVKDEFYTPDLSTNNKYLGIYGQTYDRASVPYSSNLTNGTVYYAIWGGRMWIRQNNFTGGPDVPGSNNATIAGGWNMQPTTNNTYYESKIFNIKYDFDNDIIWEQSDDRGNVIKEINSIANNIDITDWGNVEIYNNENNGIFNNFRGSTKAYINNNTNIGSIYNNSNNGLINNNSNIGNIYNNSNSSHINNNSNAGNIYNNSNSGNIQYNSNAGIIYNNSNNGNIQYNSNGGNISTNTSSGSAFFHIRYNMNNGYIQHNNSTTSIYIQYNINNGRIGASSIVDRSSTIQDTLDHK